MAVVHNLTFHGLGPRPEHLSGGEAAVWLGYEGFTAVLDEIAGRRDVRLTFDDGNRSDVELALPELRRRGLRATFFLVAGRLGDPSYLGADDVSGLVAAGMEIGSHGMRHRPWRRLDDDELAVELIDARRVLEEAAGGPVMAASCPMGAYDRRVLARARAAGFRRLFTSDRGPARSDAWLQPRSSLHRDDPVVELRRALAPMRVLTRGELAARRAIKRWR